MASLLLGVTIVFALGWCAATLPGRASAASRHLVWTCVFGAVLLLLPLRWRVPQRSIATIATPLAAVASPTVRVAPTATPAPIASQFDITPILLGLWTAGTVILMGRLLRNVFRLRAIINGAQGRAPVLTSGRVRGPVVAGLFRPVILVPAGADKWSLERRRAVLAHEAAHIRRRDPLILFAAEIATALYWFHPLCWLAAARVRAESERACDDAALRRGLRPSGYAGHLLDLARQFDVQLAIPMATTSHLESRVKSILDPLTNRSFPARAAWLAAILLTGAVLAPLSTFSLSAQPATGTATITGTVSDPTGARIPGVQLTATNSDAGNRELTTSRGDGTYTFSNIPAGHYTIEAQVPGFSALQLKDLVVVSGATLQADARLAIGNIREHVTVAAQGTPQRRAPVAGVRTPIRVGGNVQAARLLEQVRPAYPADLQAQGIEGVVLLQAIISKVGVPTSLRAQNAAADPKFVNAAMEAVNRWRYQPTLLNGEPVEVLTNIQVDFKLNAQ